MRKPRKQNAYTRFRTSLVSSSRMYVDSRHRTFDDWWAEIQKEQGKRSLRIISKEDATLLLHDMIDSNSNWSYQVGGSVANSYKYKAYTDILFIAKRSDGGVVACWRTCDAHHPSPGRAFKLLQPFRKGPSLRKRVRVWADRGGEGVVLLIDPLSVVIMKCDAKKVDPHALSLSLENEKVEERVLPRGPQTREGGAL